MKALNKTLLALAIAGSATAATAATVTPTAGIWNLSFEGTTLLNAYEQSKLALRVILEQHHNSGSFLKLTFPSTVDLTPLLTAETMVSGTQKLLQDNNDGTFTIVGGASEFLVNIGNGSFTFTGVTFDSTDNSLTLESGIGQPLIDGASIIVSLGDSTAVDVYNVDAPKVLGAATVNFDSYSIDGNGDKQPIESGASEIARVVTQYSASVAELMKETVQRLDNSRFVKDGSQALISETVSTIGKVELVQVTNIKARANLDGINLSLLSDFTDPNTVTQTAIDYSFENDGVVSSAVQGTLNLLNDTLAFNFDASQVSSAASAQTLSLDFETTGSYELQNEFDAAVTLDLSWSGATTNTSPYSVLTATDFGEWKLDAAIVNVPYMPIGYQASNGIDAVFEISNHGPQDAQIVIRGFDQDGTVYQATVLADAEGGFAHGGFAAANTVTKVSDKDVMETFGLVDGDKRKLNITFEIDAKRADIDLVPYYKQDGVRAPIINSQYKDTAER